MTLLTKKPPIIATKAAVAVMIVEIRVFKSIVLAPFVNSDKVLYYDITG